ncbi:MAG: SxtJ family membrane protein, partial [Pseudomonadota bacterium]|nr:SxtJ family membrane protein [Pseudomonadota bacterium]
MTRESNTDISAPELRQFGLLFGATLVLLFGLLLPFFIGYRFPLWPWVAAVLFTVLALLAPNALTPFYRGWMRFGLIAGFINTRMIMFLLYYALFVPTGLVMKLFGRDALARTTGGKNSDSYRVASAVRPNDHFE